MKKENKLSPVFLVLILLLTVFPTMSGENNAVPVRIILNLTTNPAQEIAVTWRTGPGVDDSRVEYLPATPKSYRSLNSDGTDPYKSVKTTLAKTETIRTGKNTASLYHSVILKDLEPDTLYQYRAGNGETWSEWCQFRTACFEEKPFTFIFLGDPQNTLKSDCSRVFRAAYSAAPGAGFMLIAGDIVSLPWLDNWWEEFFYAAGWMVRHIPVLALPGNHSYYRDNGAWRYTAKEPHPQWFAHFTLPQNGPKGLDETAYYLDYQGVRLVVLNGNEKLKEQALWLDTVLAANKNVWTILAIHQPLYSSGKDRDNPKLRKILLPVIDKYSVDLVLQGHDHTYGRTYKLKNGAVVKKRQKGTVFVSSVSGPKFYPVNEKHRHLMKKMGTDAQLFQIITVKKKCLIFEARTVTEKRYDYFELTSKR